MTRSEPLETYLSVIVPAYNEEDVIGDTLAEITGYLDKKGYSYEVIVVCDGCTDSTARIAKGLAGEKGAKGAKGGIKVIDRTVNMGKGFSVREGSLGATGEYMVFTDADLSTPVKEIDRAIESLKGGYDIAIGSRAQADSRIRVHQRRYRELMGKTFNSFVRLLAIKEFKDTQCGFKAFKRAAALEVFSRQRIQRFAFDVELLYIAKKLGYRIKEFPVEWSNRTASKVNPVTDSMRMLLDLIRIRLLDLKGAYDAKKD